LAERTKTTKINKMIELPIADVSLLYVRRPARGKVQNVRKNQIRQHCNPGGGAGAASQVAGVPALLNP
jgi:hypothetical protein